ncbi:hypothetical protein PybrP1_007839 [[Pythium] brassicae (nom. inval.)]|nr:hypothetical protein PybrP1_007839 [[Pythium] brassicae (nom. inval.)]
MALAAPLGACLHAADAHFLVLSADPALLQPLDMFLERAARAQTQREGRPPALSTDARAVLMLFLRAATLLPPVTTPEDAPNERLGLLDALLHATRVAPLCQVFAPTNAAAVARLLELLAPHAERFGVQQLQRVFRSHLLALHETVQQDKRTQVLEAIHSIYEVALSLTGLLASDAFAPLLLLERGADVELAFRSETLVRALVGTYEADLPTLQRHLVKLDESAQDKLLVIAETRHLLLQVLARFVDLLLSTRSDANHDDEALLEVLHTMSHCCDDEDADQGSYLSDLWYLCDYKDKISSYLEAGETGSEHLSYLEMIVDALPRRRVVSKSDSEPSRGDAAAAAAASRSDPALHTSATVDNSARDDDAEEKPSGPPPAAATSALVAQVRDFFPDLGDGYVELCLLSAQHELETVVNFLLESNPPPALLGVRPSLQRSDPEFAAVEAQLTGNAPVSVAAPVVATANYSSDELALDPSRVWVGKKPQEKTYDPQVMKRDSAVAEKTKKIALLLEEEEQLLAGVAPVRQLDEYDDDYNDEFEDYEPFGVHDSGQGDDQDSVRLQNRLLRAREAEDAFWEGMRNVNRLQPALSGAPIDEDAEKKLLPNAVRAGPRRAGAGGAADAAGGSEQRKKGGQQQQQPASGGKKSGAQGAKVPTGVSGATAGATEATDASPPGTKEQELRARARSAKNKAKVANHHRKERALKKQG